MENVVSYLSQTGAPETRPCETIDARELPPPQPIKNTLDQHDRIVDLGELFQRVLDRLWRREFAGVDSRLAEGIPDKRVLFPVSTVGCGGRTQSTYVSSHLDSFRWLRPTISSIPRTLLVRCPPNPDPTARRT